MQKVFQVKFRSSLAHRDSQRASPSKRKELLQIPCIYRESEMNTVALVACQCAFLAVLICEPSSRDGGAPSFCLQTTSAQQQNLAGTRRRDRQSRPVRAECAQEEQDRLSSSTGVVRNRRACFSVFSAPASACRACVRARRTIEKQEEQAAKQGGRSASRVSRSRRQSVQPWVWHLSRNLGKAHPNLADGQAGSRNWVSIDEVARNAGCVGSC